jgi:hypothetical protein
MTFDLSLTSHLCKLHIYASQLLSFPNLTNSKLLHQEKDAQITKKKMSLRNQRDEDCRMKRKKSNSKTRKKKWMDLNPNPYNSGHKPY